MTQTFTSKKKIITHLLNNEPYYQKMDDDKIEFIEDYMLDHHPDIDELHIDDIWTQKNPVYEHNNFHFNGILNGDSMKQAVLSTSRCRATPDVNNIRPGLMEAMRVAVAEDIQAIKDHCLSTVDDCEICGISFNGLTKKDIHAHHSGRWSFRALSEAFLCTDHNLIVADHWQPAHLATQCTAVPRTLEDNDSKRDWIEFHNRNATLQMVCRTCNLTAIKV